MSKNTTAYELDRIESNTVSPSHGVVHMDSGKQDRDEADLARWGKRQQLKRRFGLLSTISLTCTLMITWEGALVVFAGGLLNGGSAGLIYGFLFAWFGNVLQVLVMAELASMMPLAGGQYNWVAILSPPSCSQFLSYITGWITFILWQGALAYCSYFSGAVIQGLLVLNMPDTYVPERWHGTLLVYAVLVFSILINTLLVKIFPHIESFIFIIHVVGFFAILIPMVRFAPHNTAEAVFEVFYNGGGWSSQGLSWFIGTVPSMSIFLGIDAGSHIAEEVHNAASVIPKSMLASVAINGSLGFAMLIGILFCLGDLEAVLGTPTGLPFLQVFLDSTQSPAGASAMAGIILAAFLFAAVAALATACRMTWAFARENGLPFSSHLSRIDGRTTLPLYSLAFSALITALLSLINIGSLVAFNALISLVIAAFYSAFFISASLLLYRKLTGDGLQYGPFRLGRAGVPIIIASLIYTVIGFFFSFWPPVVAPTPELMNWSIVVFGGAVLFALVFYVTHGRKVYHGPIVEVVLD